ncbi:ATP-binding protein [Phenylobacterium aquaticum]|uniref:ATP-binding protein n=1 Tax=Phenylobacterium aquaticum TaxID=1763816 RepID=UPI001F5D1BCC|nr:ATP-binding protein [Phenylobacterium aquaticum]MCI3133590.1 ATP-binding protein [Phenylobacterium aquaticum]
MFTSVPPNIEGSGLAARLAGLAQQDMHALMLCDPEGRLVWINEGFTRLTGFSAQEALGHRPGALLASPDTDTDTLATLRAHMAACQPFRAEVENQDKSGRRFWIDLHVRPLLNACGVLEGFSGLMIESAPRIHLQEQLKAAAASLSSAAQLARLGGWEADLRRQVIRWSPELKTLLGRPEPVEPISKSLEIYPDETRDGITDLLTKAIAAGERIEFEAPVLTGSGEQIWLRVIGELELVNGRCVAVRGASQDVTAQRQANAELRASERFGRGVIDGIGAFLSVIDQDGAIVEANKAFRTLAAQLSQVEVYPMGRNLFTILAGLPGRHGAALTRGIRAVLAGERPTYSRAYSSRSCEWFRLTASRFDGEGPVRCVVITQSIEDLKRQERRLMEMNQRLKRARDEAHSASQSKSAFLATMSHEIRTPLNGVLGMAQAMARDELTDVQRERLGVIRQAGETLLVLLNDLLDLSRIEAGKLDLEDGVLDIRQMLAGVQATFTTLAADKDVSLAIHIAPEAEGRWRGDPTRVRQILYNLVSNAVKFTARGAVEVTVKLGAPGLVFSVSDTGPGIADDRMARLFEKFVQADASTTRRYGGSGLGLAICRQLADMMGGEIEAHSELDVGSTFTVTLPLERLEGEGPPPLVETRQEAPDGRLDLRILAAEDNPMNQMVLKTLLAQLGLEVHCVGDGRQAVEAWSQGQWDAILMDVQMPVMDGPAATREIRRRESESGRVRTPIIALTANAMAHHQAEYLGAGMDVMVPKPLELERLLLAIQDVLDEADAGQIDIV